MTASHLAPGHTPRQSFVVRWFFEAVPATRLATLRVMIFGFAVCYLLARSSHLTDFSGWDPASFQPVGPAALLNSPLPQLGVYGAFVCCVACGMFAVFGKYYKCSAPAFAALLLWVTSYRNSWGQVFHTENLFVLHALVLAVSPAADCWAKDGAVDPLLLAERERQGCYSWAVKTLSLLTVITYVIAGVAKLKIAGLSWAEGAQLQVHIAYDAVRKIELGSWASPLARPFVAQAWLFPPLAWLTLAFELGAPVALLGRRPAIVWASIAWGFHCGVLATMAIVFPYPLVGLAFASFFAPERRVERWLLRRFSKTKTAGRSRS